MNHGATQLENVTAAAHLEATESSLCVPETEQATEAREQAVIIVTSLGHALCHVGELVIIGALFAVASEFGLDPSRAVTLTWPVYVLMGLGALPFGWWGDSWGPTRLLAIYFAALAAAGFAVALAPSVGWLFVALIGLGFAVSIYHPVGLALISLGVRDRGRAMGINGAAGSLGVATGPALGMWAASLGLWRMGFVVLGVLSLAALVLLWVWTPAALGGRRAVRQPIPPPVLPASGTGRSGLRGRYVALGLLMTAMMLGGFNYRCLVTALPAFLTGTAPDPTSLAKGGVFVWVALVVGGIGQYVGGQLAERTGPFRLYLALLGMLVGCAVLLPVAGGSAFATLAACGLAVCLFALQPIENIILADWTTAGRRSLSYAAKFAFTFGVGALGTPVVGKVWSEFNSLGLVFLLLAVSATLMATLTLAAVLVWKRSRVSAEV